MINIVKSEYYSNETSPSFIILHRGYYFSLRTGRVKDVGVYEFSEWGVSCIGNDVKIADFPTLEEAMDFIIDDSYDEWDDDYYDYDCISSYIIDVNSPAEWKDFL